MSAHGKFYRIVLRYSLAIAVQVARYQQYGGNDGRVRNNGVLTCHFVQYRRIQCFGISEHPAIQKVLRGLLGCLGINRQLRVIP